MCIPAPLAGVRIIKVQDAYPVEPGGAGEGRPVEPGVAGEGRPVERGVAGEGRLRKGGTDDGYAAQVEVDQGGAGQVEAHARPEDLLGGGLEALRVLVRD